MRLRSRLAVAALLLSAAALSVPSPAAACGPSEAACTVAGGEYRIRLPEGPGPHPAVLYLHGHGGSGARAISLDRRVGDFLAAGYAVIGPDGDRWRGPASPRGWNAMASAARRDDVAFLRAVADDAAGRFGLARDRILAAGFSSGGMMVWRLACDAPRAFAAYAPVAGTFWKPIPKSCAAPVALLHTHGTQDRVVPMEGRSIGGGRLVQGDVGEALGMMARASRCAARPASGTDRLGAAPEAWRLSEWAGCAPGAAQVVAVWDGGHDVPQGWARAALAFIGSLGRGD